MTQSTPQRVNRMPERASTDRAVLDAILDASPFGTLSTVRDGLPWVVPLLIARDGDRILVHGSTGAGALRHVAAGAPVVISVAHLDGIVVAHTTFESSANYRSAVVHGVLEPLQGEDQATVLDAISDALIPGRVAEVRPMKGKEKAATLAMQLRIIDGRWTVKARDDWSDLPEPEDADTQAWIGVVPLRVVAGDPQTAPFSPTDEVPESVQRLVQRYQP